MTTEKTPLKKHIFWFFLSVVIVQALNIPTLEISIVDSGWSIIRISSVFSSVSGLLMGPASALGCAVSNVLFDMFEGDIGAGSVAGAMTNFMIPWLSYKLWHTLFPSKGHRLSYIHSANGFLKMLAVLFCSQLTSMAFLAASEELLGYGSFHDVILSPFLCNLYFAMFCGITLFLVVTSVFGFTPYYPKRAYRAEYRHARFIPDYVVIVLTLIIFIEKIEEEHIKSVYNPTFSAILDIALIVFALYLAFSPMVRSRRKAERLPEYKSRKELQTQIILIVFVLAALCNIFFFVMIEYLMLSNGGFTETSALNITQNVLIFINVSLLVYVTLFYIVIRMFERGVTKPIKNLSKSVDNFVKNGLTVPPEVNSRRLSYEIATLGNSFEKMSDDITNYIEKIKADDLEISRTHANMEAAARIQQGILPEIPKNGRFDISAFIKPALTMGGDFYDVISLDKDRLLLCIGDVSSKGLPAAVFMVETGMLVKSSKHCSPEKILTNINTVLCENNSENMFVSLFVGIIDTADMTLAFSNAGHNYPVLWRGGKPSRLDTPPEIVLGVTDFEYTLHTVDIDSDFRLLLYTDGVTEAENSGGELYGDSRLDAICKKITAENNSDDTIEALLESIKEFAEKAPQSDDITILTVRIKK